MCIDEGVLMKVWFLKLWEHFFACKRYCKQMQKKQSFEKRCLKSFQSFQSTSALHPFNPPKTGGPGLFLTGPTGGLQKIPAYPPSHRRFRKAELQELNNGRLAMMGITGLIAQAVRLDDRRWVGRHVGR